VVLLALVFVGKNITSAQSPATKQITGTWNFTGAIAGNPPLPIIFVMTFNQGGTTVEFDTFSTGNPSTQETISLGTWQSAGGSSFTFKEENYAYDSLGNLSKMAIATGDITLDSTGSNATGTGTISFYSCTVSQCPGSLLSGPIQLTFSGQRI
jgi:hypothetical protein